jgi:hypothetical protein
VKKTIIAIAVSISSFHTLAGSFDIEYIDVEGVGSFDPTPITKPDGTLSTLGDYRQELIEFTARAVSLQFNFDVDFYLKVDFGTPDGYAATTLGPIFSTHYEAAPDDDFGILEIGRSYPQTLESALRGVDVNNIDEDAIISFANTPSYVNSDHYQYPYVVHSAYHEMMHVLGFSAPDCLGNCIPEPITFESHISAFFYYNDEGNIRSFDSLDITEKQDVAMLTDSLWFFGSEPTKKAAEYELTSGHTNGNIYIHTTPDEYSGGVDPQALAHLSPNVQPEQLMHSYGARTEDLGMAAYILCDIGWCRNQGKVIEQSVSLSLNENASSESETSIDVVITDNLGVGVDEWELNLVSTDINILSIEGNSANCSATDNGYYCTGHLAPSEQVLIQIFATPAESYTIDGELRSMGLDVDRNGFNNIVDTTLITEGSDPGDDGSDDDGNDDDGSDDDDSDDDGNDDDGSDDDDSDDDGMTDSSGGGTMHFLLFPLAIMGIFRRLKLKS